MAVLIRFYGLRMLKKLVVGGVVVFAVLQAVRPAIPAKPAAAEVQASADVKNILDKDCYSCHSDERRLSWFDQIVPAYWLVRYDILTAREHLNFSTTGFEACGRAESGALRGCEYDPAWRHAAAELPEAASRSESEAGGVGEPESLSRAMVLGPEPSAWRALRQRSSFRRQFLSRRFSRNSMGFRSIRTSKAGDYSAPPIAATTIPSGSFFGNDIAVKAAQSGAISPWPDGTRFAKVAWQQEAGSDGLVHPGKFVQVELMVKDARRYKDAEGWGWGRWRGLDLKPYGSDSAFVDECTGYACDPNRPHRVAVIPSLPAPHSPSAPLPPIANLPRDA